MNMSFISAHWDHLGVGAPDKTGDTIYNGAVDNASGVASVWLIAEALQKLPPAATAADVRVSSCFGRLKNRDCWARNWYSKHPLVPVKRLRRT